MPCSSPEHREVPDEGFAGTTPPSHSAINGRICWYNTTLPQCNQRQDLLVQHHPPTVQSTAGFAGTTPPSHSAINGRICGYNTTLPQCNQRQDLMVQHHPPTVQSTAGFDGTTPPSHSTINGRETKIWSGKTTCSTLVTQTVRTRTVISRNDEKRATLPG